MSDNIIPFPSTPKVTKSEPDWLDALIQEIPAITVSFEDMQKFVADLEDAKDFKDSIDSLEFDRVIDDLSAELFEKPAQTEFVVASLKKLLNQVKNSK